MCSQKVLLFNASNMDVFPVYPYAFIQIPAVARLSGIEVICKDLLGIPYERWKQTIQTLIEQHNPAMILITLRNTDTFDSPDYEENNLKEGGRSAYFPIERTRELIAAIREISDLKIAVGGVGFSLLPGELMSYLRPDFGVFEGPNDFFAHFEDVNNGNPAKVANLLFFQDEQLISNPRRLFPPLADAEYTPQAIEAMMKFYASFPSPGFDGAPVEVMRGCNHSCVFCTEPHSKGAKVRYRDLAAVMKDIEILVNHGITQLYIISSELNPEGNEFILELADSIWSFNELQADDRKITWYGANYLLKFESDEYERLYRSGFTGGWFDFTALDDKNARAMRTPYRNARLLAHLKIYAEHQEKLIALRRAQKVLGADAKARAGGGREDEFVIWTMFLGNTATTIETIRNTLRTANQKGLSNIFDRCGLHVNTRVFDYEEPTEATLAVTYSVTPDLKRTRYRQLLPSFAYPPALSQDFSEKEISEMFDHIADTYLSTNYQQSRDWHGFVKQNATAASIASWMVELSDTKGVYIPAHIRPTSEGDASTALQRLFSEEPQDEDRHICENLAKQVVDSLLTGCLDVFPELFRFLGLPNTRDKLERMTSYELAVGVFNKWRTEKELIDKLTEQTKSVLTKSMQDLNRFCVRAMLYRFNVLINPKYRGLFVSVGSTGTERG